MVLWILPTPAAPWIGRHNGVIRDLPMGEHGYAARPALPFAHRFVFEESRHFQLSITRPGRTLFGPTRAIKNPPFGAGVRILTACSGFYPPPPRPGFVAMIVLSVTWQWAHTNMRHGLPCRSPSVSGLENLNMLNSGADDWILTSDLLLTGQAP